MSTFIETMYTMANDSKVVADTYLNERISHKKIVIDKMMKSITFIYYTQIKAAIEYASKHGRCYVHINFDKNNFKANCPRLSPRQVLNLWLREMTNPQSKYLNSSGSVFNCNVINKDSFKGIKWNIWNNDRFTAVLCWDEQLLKNGGKWSDFWTGGKFSKYNRVNTQNKNIQLNDTINCNPFNSWRDPFESWRTDTVKCNPFDGKHFDIQTSTWTSKQN